MRRWDIFCRVVDNYGDIGVCWRLARQLAERVELEPSHVRLWVDDLQSFSRLCPSIVPGLHSQHAGSIEVCHWSPDFSATDAADVVIEAFACELPPVYVEAMAARARPPVWINLEYLSAEDWVEGCHLLPSPNPVHSLTKYFFFPGFTSRTGGLLRETGLMQSRAAFDDDAEAAFCGRIGVPARQQDELRISLFCYQNVALPDLLQSLAMGAGSVRLLTCPGAATEQVSRWIGKPLSVEKPEVIQSLTVQAIPFLSHSDYDRLLWSCDVNFVRGEDSFVRAQWAQRPFIWQIYPQAEATHLVKLRAFLDRFLHDFVAPQVVTDCWRAWNGGDRMSFAWQNYVAKLAEIRRYGEVWAGQLDHAADLANNLVRFVREQI